MIVRPDPEPSTVASRAVAHFQLVTVDGEALGATELARPDWPPGSVIYRPPGEPNLRVVDYIPTDDPEEFAILVVEPAD